MIRLWAVVLVAAAGACGESLPADTNGGGDAGAPAPVDPCAQKVVYVAADKGKDGNDGCTPETAVRTISGAIGLVTARKLFDHEIHVCAGRYPEQALSLGIAVSLRGGYDCETWTRSAPPEVTQVENAGFPATATTLLVAGAAVGKNVVVEGFTILGPGSGAASSVALGIGDSAAPVLRDLVVVGGATTGAADGFGSVGIDIASGAAPEIDASDIRGGAGVAPSGSVSGSTAVRMHGAGAAWVHDSKIASGSGTGFYGSIGINIDTSTGVRIERNDLGFGGSTANAANGAGAVGINVADSDVSIEGNLVRGAKAACGNGSCGILGIVVAASNRPGATARIVRNRIYGGDLVATGAAPLLSTDGIFLGASVDATVTSNIVHAGGAQTATSAPNAVVADSVKRLLLHGNTILATSKVATGNTALSVSAFAAGQSKDVGVVGNVFVGGALAADYGVHTRTCQGVAYTAFASNAFVGFHAVEVEEAATCGAAGAVDHVYPEAVETRIGSTAHGNLVVRPACNDTRCVGACDDDDACAALVFAQWDAAGVGTKNATDDGGAKLLPAAPCEVVHSDATLDPAALVDLYGATRTVPYAMGAHEAEACQ